MPADNPLHRALYLTGPTASGKTAVGMALARRIDAEIIALDSMTLYRGMDIGTAKPTDEERKGIPHHLIDVLEPSESASVAVYREWAIEVSRQIEARGKRVLFVGGTALYLKALLRGLFDGPAADAEVRRGLEAEAELVGDRHGMPAPANSDPITAARLHPNDRRRIILRARSRSGDGAAVVGLADRAWNVRPAASRSGSIGPERRFGDGLTCVSSGCSRMALSKRSAG